MRPAPGVSKETLAGDLARLGVRRGDTLLVHSSLSSMGHVEDGADAAIGALLEALGDEGTLLMPSFQSGLEYVLASAGCVFDVRTSPSEMGLITETFRRRPGVLRSLSPTHCTAGCGPRAKTLLEGHHQCTVSVGKNSPYHQLAESGGKILLLGVTHSSNTSLHFVENCYGAPTVCRTLFNPVVIDTDGTSHVVPTYPHMPGLQRVYTKVEELLLDRRIQVNGKVGQADARLIDAGGMAEEVGKRIRENPLYLINVFTP